MSKGFITELGDRSVAAVGGADARSFLQGVITTDLDTVKVGEAGYGALLTPQGKILFDFLILADGARFLFDLPEDLAADFVKRLSLYRLRAKVDIAIADDLQVHAAWGNDAPPEMNGCIGRDRRHPELGFRAIVPEFVLPAGYTAASPTDYHAHRIALGVPQGGVDFAYGDAFPHDADMDRLGGVDFHKGCYIGQEVVSRMEHRGTARRRVIRIAGDGALPPTGTPIAAHGRPIGTVGSTAGRDGLALVRLDRAIQAMAEGFAITAGPRSVRLDIPEWAKVADQTADGED